MENQTVTLIQQNIARSYEGTIAFPEIVTSLLAANIERYFVDLSAAKSTYYHHNGDAIQVDLPAHDAPQATPPFSPEAVIAAIRASQNGQINYTEFMRQILNAGTVGYLAFLTGKQVTYFGAKGEFHIEKFPQ